MEIYKIKGVKYYPAAAAGVIIIIIIVINCLKKYITLSNIYTKSSTFYEPFYSLNCCYFVVVVIVGGISAVMIMVTIIFLMVVVVIVVIVVADNKYMCFGSEPLKNIFTDRTANVCFGIVPLKQFSAIGRLTFVYIKTYLVRISYVLQ